MATRRRRRREEGVRRHLQNVLFRILESPSHAVRARDMGWLFASPTGRPGEFVTICLDLGLDPQAIRRAVLWEIFPDRVPAAVVLSQCREVPHGPPTPLCEPPGMEAERPR